VFDIDKLEWLNFEYLKVLDDAAWVAKVRSWRLSDGYLARLAPLVRERVRRFDQFVPYAEFFFSGDLEPARTIAELVPKERSAKETGQILEVLVDELDERRIVFEKEPLMTFLREFCERKGWKSKELFMAVRVAVTGRTAAPPLDETLVVLGKELSRRRLRLAADALKKSP
jgi:glutamyl-tRNA synthetase